MFGGIVLLMNAEHVLADTATLFLALGDKTRLRLLNLMRDREICVSEFTGILGQSQPLISRHLAYLRNAGVVTARREGKWMHYGISAELDDNTRRLLSELFKWMASQDGLKTDRDKYDETHSHEEHVSKPTTRGAVRQVSRVAPAPPEPEDDLDEPFVEEPEVEIDRYEPARHNELEDFLL